LSTFSEALDKMYPPTPEEMEKPEFWREGDPMPEWAREAFRKESTC